MLKACTFPLPRCKSLTITFLYRHRQSSDRLLRVASNRTKCSETGKEGLLQFTRGGSTSTFSQVMLVQTDPSLRRRIRAKYRKVAFFVSKKCLINLAPRIKPYIDSIIERTNYQKVNCLITLWLKIDSPFWKSKTCRVLEIQYTPISDTHQTLLGLPMHPP